MAILPSYLSFPFWRFQIELNYPGIQNAFSREVSLDLKSPIFFLTGWLYESLLAYVVDPSLLVFDRASSSELYRGKPRIRVRSHGRLARRSSFALRRYPNANSIPSAL